MYAVSMQITELNLTTLGTLTPERSSGANATMARDKTHATPQIISAGAVAYGLAKRRSTRTGTVQTDV